MNWEVQINKIVEMNKTGRFHEAYEICKRLLAKNLTKEQKAYIYYEMGMCKFYLRDYISAEEHVIKSLERKDTKDSYELLRMIYELDLVLPNELSYLIKLTEIYPDSNRLKYKLIALYHKKELYHEMVAVKRNEELLKSNYLCRILSDAYMKLFDVKSAVRIYDTYIKLMREHQASETDFYTSIEVLRPVISMLVYEEIYSDEEYLNFINFLYKNTQHKKNEVQVNTSFFRKITIGILSSDIRSHPVGLFLISLLTEHSKNESISYVIYDTNNISDVVTKFIKDNVNKYYNVNNLTNEALEEFILNDKLDILLELNGLSEHHKLQVVKNRVAPIQISWIGFPATSALPNIDYVILDKLTAIKDYEDNYYTEKIIRMNQVSLCYCIDTTIQKEEPPFIKNGYITFASFSNTLKFSKKILKCWAILLNRVANSKLFLMTRSINTEVGKNALIGLLSDTGISIDRVIFEEYKDFQTYLNNYNKVDLILDTYPFNGATTTAEALSFGVPVVSLYGKHHVSRVGLSMLTALGLSEFATESEETYIEKAVELAQEKEKLYIIHQTLRNKAKNSPLCNRRLFQTEFENRLRSVYLDYCICNPNKKEGHDNIKAEIKTAITFIECLNEDYKTKEEYSIFMQKLQAIRKEIYELFDMLKNLLKFNDIQEETKFYIDLQKLNQNMSRKKLYEYLKYLEIAYLSER